VTGYTVTPARYSKGNFIIRPLDSVGGFKGRASYLCCALNLRWTHRSGGFTASPSKLSRFEKLYAEGWSATCMGELIAPRDESL
jgi:hypothetical protein